MSKHTDIYRYFALPQRHQFFNIEEHCIHKNQLLTDLWNITTCIKSSVTHYMCTCTAIH